MPRYLFDETTARTIIECPDDERASPKFGLKLMHNFSGQNISSICCPTAFRDVFSSQCFIRFHIWKSLSDPLISPRAEFRRLIQTVATAEKT
jgi:hypothetical protein